MAIICTNQPISWTLKGISLVSTPLTGFLQFSMETCCFRLDCKQWKAAGHRPRNEARKILVFHSWKKILSHVQYGVSWQPILPPLTMYTKWKSGGLLHILCSTTFTVGSCPHHTCNPILGTMKPSLGPRPKTDPSADHFQYPARYTGSDIRTGWGLGTRLYEVLKLGN